MLYRLLGMAVWKLGVRYVRRNYGRRLRTMAVLGLLGLGVGGYLASRSGD